jgi:hypothetical protein
MFHRTCGGKVGVEVKDCFSLIAELSTSPVDKQINTVRINIYQHTRTLTDFSYECTNCGDAVEVDDLLFNCRYCGENIRANETFIPLDSNGTYCEDCCDNMVSEEDRISMEQLLSQTHLNIV